MSKDEFEIDREVIAAANRAHELCPTAMTGTTSHCDQFIARARERWPAALDEVERLREEGGKYVQAGVNGIAEAQAERDQLRSELNARENWEHSQAKTIRDQAAEIKRLRDRNASLDARANKRGLAQDKAIERIRDAERDWTDE